MKNPRFAMCFLCTLSLAFAKADNTKKNKRDRDPGVVTADQQLQNESDLELTRKIRKALTDDSTLSTYAKNIKIISRQGKVTLRGPVNTAEERMKVENFAKSIAGAANIINQIEIVKKTKES